MIASVVAFSIVALKSPYSDWLTFVNALMIVLDRLYVAKFNNVSASIRIILT